VVARAFLPEKHIQREADLLLAEYGERFEQVVGPPIPIDEIIELHLLLTFEIGDLREMFGVGDIHGAIWINQGRIAVDRSLDPSANPRKLGRYRKKSCGDRIRTCDLEVMSDDF